MKHHSRCFRIMLLCLSLALPVLAKAQSPRNTGWEPRATSDTLQAGALPADPTSPDRYPNVWSLAATS